MSRLPWARAPRTEEGRAVTVESPSRLGALKACIVLAALFNLFALLVLIRHTPIGFTVFMFLGQPLFVLSLVLLLGAVLADLKAKGLL